MEPEGSIPPVTCPYPAPDHSRPFLPSHFLKNHLNTSILLSSHLRLGLPGGLFPSGFPTKTPHTPILSPMRATCPAHLIPYWINQVLRVVQPFINLLFFGYKNVNRINQVLKFLYLKNIRLMNAYTTYTFNVPITGHPLGIIHKAVHHHHIQYISICRWERRSRSAM